MDANITVRLINETKAGFSSIQSDLNRMTSALNTITTLFAGAFSARAIKDIVDNVETLNNKIKVVSTSSEDFAKKYAEIYKIAQATGQPINELGNLYTKLDRSQKVAGISAEQVGKVTEVFANALRVSGTNAAGSAAALLQFSQALQSGRLSGDEFRTILEQTPILLQKVADALGVSYGELRKLSQEQKLTSEVVAKAMLLMGDEISELANKMNFTLAQSLTRVSNSLQKTAKEFLDSSGAMEVVNKIADYLIKNMDSIVPVLGLVASALGVIATVMVGPWAAAFLGGTALLIAFAEEVAPLAKTVLKLFGDALKFVIGQVSGLAAALIELAKGNFSNVFNAYDKAVQGVNNTLTPTTEKQQGLNQAITEGAENTKQDSAEKAALREELLQLGQKLTEGASEYAKFNEKLDESIRTSGLDTDEKKKQGIIYDAMKAKAKDLGVQVSDLSEDIVLAIEQEIGAKSDLILQNEKELESRQKLYTEAINLLENYSDEAEKFRVSELSMTEKYLMDQEKLDKAYAEIRKNDAKLTSDELAKIEQQYQDAKNLLQQKGIEELRKKYQQYIDNTKTDTEKFNEELAKLDEARQIAGLEGEEAYQQALEGLRAKYGEKFRKIAEDQRKSEMTAMEVYYKDMEDLNQAANDGLIKNQEDYDAVRRKIEKDYRDTTVKEYGNLYSALEEKIIEFTGMNKKEIGLLEDTFKLVFGVNIRDVIKMAFAEFIKYVIGFREAAGGEMNIVQSVISKVFGTKGTASKEVEIFKSEGTSILKSMSEGFGSIFNGLVGILKNVFGSGLSIIGDFVSSGLSMIGKMGGSIGDVFSSIFSGGGGGGSIMDVVKNIPIVGDVVSGISGAIGSITGGAAGTAGGSALGALTSNIGFGGTAILATGLYSMWQDFKSRPGQVEMNISGVTGHAGSRQTGYEAAAGSAGGRLSLYLQAQEKNLTKMGTADELYFALKGMPYPAIYSSKPSKQRLEQQWNKIGVSSLTGMSFDQAINPYYYARMGMAVSGGQKIRGYQYGGIVDQRTMFGMRDGLGMMGEAGPEAILPLERNSNGELGVKTTGAGNVNVNFTINAMDGKSVETVLIDKRRFIMDMVRSAMLEKGRSYA